ncbi:FAD-binding protein [Corynebacterium kroppenstedtii]|uniref:FAD-binding protein n=1 Tax=Corynebacterium sp. PCR 32 TaxID=3351342 RepID=UPI00309E3646
MTVRDRVFPSPAHGAARMMLGGLSSIAVSGISRVSSHIGVDRGVVRGPRGGLRPEELTAAHWGDGSRRVVDPIGWWEHQRGVDKLRESFDAIPRSSQVRLAKTTSNLFRSRTAPTSPGLNVEGLGRVIAVDTVAQTADVQGMCTYEDLVDTLLPFGFAPYVVPELKTITLGGAVTGMGVESSCFRNGLPHESVVEMDILTGTGEIVTCSPVKNVDLFRTYPNSYGSLGYAVRITIKIEKVQPFVELRHVRFHDVTSIAAAIDDIVACREYDGEAVDYLDGVVFSPTEGYLVLGRQSSEVPSRVSTYTKEHIYYRSIQHPEGITRDTLTMHDYLWRWDTDWFWCSRAFGAQNPMIRRMWPEGLLRSSFYWKLVGADKRWDIADRIERHHGRPARERVVQDVEVTTDRVPEFLDWFFTASEIQPVWLCPLKLADESSSLTTRGDVLSSDVAQADGAGTHPWPLYPLSVGDVWVNIGFWSSVPVDMTGDPRPGAFNRVIERKMRDVGGHKSLYSEAFYSEEEFAALYGGTIPELVKKAYDPERRFPGLFDKAVGGK